MGEASDDENEGDGSEEDEAQMRSKMERLADSSDDGDHDAMMDGESSSDDSAAVIKR